MVKDKSNDQNLLGFSEVLDELALIYVLKQEVAKQMGEEDVISSSDDETKNKKSEKFRDKMKKSMNLLVEKKKSFKEAETLGEIKIVREMQEKQKQIVERRKTISSNMSDELNSDKNSFGSLKKQQSVGSILIKAT